MAPNPLVVGAPSYGALEHTGRMRCGPYVGEERNLPEVPSRHAAAQRLTVAYKGEEQSGAQPFTASDCYILTVTVLVNAQSLPTTQLSGDPVPLRGTCTESHRYA